MSSASEWKIFYHDREPYGSSDGTPISAPATGVLLIVQKGTLVDGEHILNGGNYYWWQDGLWHNSQTEPSGSYIEGVTTDQSTWENAKQEAIDYAEL